jgi:membrane protein
MLAALKWPIGLVVYWFFLAVVYKLLPGKRISIKHTIPGSLFAAAGIIIITAGYSIYLKHFSSFNVVYGSMGAVIALLFWFYLVGYILVLGMVINSVWFDEG